MSVSFGQLFRASKLASFDPTISQVYTVPKANKLVGDWGLKRNLPSSWRSPLITVKALDTQQNQTPFDSAQHEVLTFKRMVTNIGNPSREPWKGVLANMKTHLSELSDSEFEKLLEKCKEKRDEWNSYKSPYSTNSIKEQILSFLNLNDSVLDTYIRAPPSYRNTYGESRTVKGRILGQSASRTYLVGLNGIVGELTSYDNFKLGGHNRLDLNPFNHELRTFYLSEVNFNTDSGYPKVKLLLHQEASGRGLDQAIGANAFINKQLSMMFDYNKKRNQLEVDIKNTLAKNAPKNQDTEMNRSTKSNSSTYAHSLLEVINKKQSLRKNEGHAIDKNLLSKTFDRRK